MDNLLGNPPSSVSLRIRSADNVTGVLPFDPNGAPAYLAAVCQMPSISHRALTKSQRTCRRWAPILIAPAVGAIVGTIKAPEWQEWNFSVQQELNRSTVLIVNYVGNHGARISYSNAWPNAYDAFGLYNGTVPAAP